MDNKYDALRKKIKPKSNNKNFAEVVDRFTRVDQLQCNSEEKITIKPEKIERKTFALTQQEILALESIKDRALNIKLVLTDSEIVRLGILLASELQEQHIKQKIQNMPKQTRGRPRSK